MRDEKEPLSPQWRNDFAKQRSEYVLDGLTLEFLLLVAYMFTWFMALAWMVPIEGEPQNKGDDAN